jgi:phage baseplate assembly protein V
MDRIARALWMLVCRGVVAAVNDGARMQALQLRLTADETKDGVERFQPFGLTAHPMSGAEAVVLFPGGRRDHALCVVVDDRRHRPTGLEPGETCLYNAHGITLTLKDDGTLTIVAPTKVRIETPLLEVTGEIRDRCDADGTTMEAMRTAYDGHRHGGVQTGGGQTATPTPTIG